ncbi:uncharacterized protein LOC133199127 [Saccostrea echinata]|uniref:uncharacterized protein LOC133199127 n=1 Tax=Saccostrea echinata TaxID=191078 RepID=UPI002A8062D3|nr:uncharacterized protein LOC133199127 [Saccostrea echinata]
MDIQLIGGAYGVAYYVCSYICKAEPETLKTAISNVIREISEMPSSTTTRSRMFKLERQKKAVIRPITAPKNSPDYFYSILMLYLPHRTPNDIGDPNENIMDMPSSLSDCFTKECGNLITEFVTVKVIDVLPLINYKKQSGETGKMFTAAICDATYACIAKVYDSEKVTTILPNQVLILENFFIRDGEISITNRTHVYRTGVPLKVPDDIMDKASSLLTGTKHTDKSPTSIVDAAISPKKTILSVKGIVYKTNDLEKKTIRSTGEEVAFRRLKIKDETSKICVVLWRKLAEEPFTTNEVVQFNNFQVSDTFGTDGKSVPSLTNKLSSSSIQVIKFKEKCLPQIDNYTVYTAVYLIL